MAITNDVNRSSTIGINATKQNQGTERQAVIGDENGSFTVKKGDVRRNAGGTSAIAAKFADIKAKFKGLIRNLKEAHTARVEHQAEKRIQAKVDRWHRSTVNLDKVPGMRNAHDVIDPAHKLLKGGEIFGGKGIHKVAEHLIADAHNQAREINLKGGNTTWQQVLESRLTREMVQSEHGKTKEDAKANLDTLLRHFATYEQVPNAGDLGDMAKILRSVEKKTTSDDGIVALARNAFQSELDKQLKDVEQFFRGTSLGSAASSSVLRNLNTATTERISQSFADVMTDPNNKADVDLAESVPPSVKPTPEQMQAITRLTEQFLDKAFGLGVDGGKGFVDNMDKQVVGFLKETTAEIQGKTKVDQDVRNAASQKWLSNGVALRDFAPVATQIGRDLDLGKSSSLVATMVLRVVGNVHPNAAVAGLGEHNRQAYQDLIGRRGPQFQELLGHLGLPKPN